MMIGEPAKQNLPDCAPTVQQDAVDISNINPERVRLLVEALRSGRFQQGNGRLVTIDGDGSEKHCCLGVACVIAMENGLKVSTFGGTQFGRAFDGEQCYLPPSVRNWYGFTDRHPPIYAYTDVTSGDLFLSGAAGINDAGRWGFAEIADAFERTYLTTTPTTAVEETDVPDAA